MTLKTRDIERALPTKGFEREQGSHIRFTFRFGGKDCGISTYISHGEQEIGDSLIGRMAKQVRLSKADFAQLVACPMGHDDFVAELKRQGFLPP